MSIDGEVLSFKNYLEEQKEQIHQKLSIYYGFLNGIYPSRTVELSPKSLFDKLNYIYNCEMQLKGCNGLGQLKSSIQERLQTENGKANDTQLEYQLGLIKTYYQTDGKALVKSRNI